MKKLFLLLVLLRPFIGLAQTSYTVDWYKIAGGGNSVPSTNSTYQVSGTAGQLDAGGPMTNSEYSVTGGFWSLYAVQAPGTPKLTITFFGGEGIVSWPYPSTGWVLQQCPTPNGNWYDTPNVFKRGTNYFAVFSPSQGMLYFRLVYVLQSPGAPTMQISLTGQPPSTIVSWTYPSPGWTLQTNNDLATGMWGNYVGTVVNNTITNPLPKGNLFFRLQAP